MKRALDLPRSSAAVALAMKDAQAALRTALLAGSDTSAAREYLADLGRELAAIAAVEAEESAAAEQRLQVDQEAAGRDIADREMEALHAGLVALQPRPAPGVPA